MKTDSEDMSERDLRKRQLNLAPIMAIEAANLIQTVTNAADEISDSTSVEHIARCELIQLLTRRLPKHACVVSGRIVDERGTLSAPLDVIVVDDATYTLLSENSQFPCIVPYETVYAIGAVHPKFKPLQVERFCMKYAHLSTELSRENTPANSHKRNGIRFTDPASPLPEHHFRNPIFTFFLALDSSAFPIALNHADETSKAHYYLHELYLQYSPYQPTFLALLDKLSVVPLLVRKEAGINIPEGIITTPQYIDELPPPDESMACYWTIIQPGSETGERPAANLALLLSLLIEHMDKTILTKDSLAYYFQTMQGRFKERIHLLGPIARD